MRPRALLLFALAALVGSATAVLPALAAPPSEAQLEVNENCVEDNWPCWAASGSGSKPQPASKITIVAGGEVMFHDNDTTKTNIAWVSNAPACSPSVPVSPSSPQAPWEGKCKFDQPGVYEFESSTLFNGGPSLNYTKYEIVVESGAAGSTTTTTTSSATTTTPTTPSAPSPTTPGEPVYSSPLEGGSTALTLAGIQRGSTVHGSVNLSQAGSGGRLEVRLFAASTALAKADHSRQVGVGRLTNSSSKAGRISFSVPLSVRGKTSLRRHRHLALTVKITLTPLHGAIVRLTRVVVLHV